MSREERTLSTSRTLPFPPMAVYGAFASPDLLARWWGPDGFTNTFDIFEFKAGGRWKFVMHGPDGKSYANESVFTELAPGRCVVIEHVCAPRFVLTVALAPAAGGTRVSWMQVFADAETARAVERIVGPANEQNLDRLTQVLSETQAA
ncbi:MAG: SRPBCC domain-containing protein [Propionivibrio sp.]